MADVVDQAQATTDLHLRAAHEAQLKRASVNACPVNAGICWVCDDPIDPKRLAALPDAALCIDCAEQAERNAQRGAAR